jgi:hypothetical protein
MRNERLQTIERLKVMCPMEPRIKLLEALESYLAGDWLPLVYRCSLPSLRIRAANGDRLFFLNAVLDSMGVPSAEAVRHA